MKQYEAMFLFDPTFGNSFENCEAEIRRLIDRAQGEIILCRKWDERRLAYRIKKRKRGVYVLVYFKAPPDKIAPLERDVKLSEDILRVLILQADDVSSQAMERAFIMWRDEPEKTAEASDKALESTAATGEGPLNKDLHEAVSMPVVTETAGADTKDDGTTTTE